MEEPMGVLFQNFQDKVGREKEQIIQELNELKNIFSKYDDEYNEKYEGGAKSQYIQKFLIHSKKHLDILKILVPNHLEEHKNNKYVFELNDKMKNLLTPEQIENGNKKLEESNKLIKEYSTNYLTEIMLVLKDVISLHNSIYNKVNEINEPYTAIQNSGDEISELETEFDKFIEKNDLLEKELILLIVSGI